MSATATVAYKGIGMEGWIARWYARTRRNNAADFQSQAEIVAARLGARGDVLEVAPGPGYFAIALVPLGDFRITGLDISRTFVEIATRNATEAGAAIDFQLGNASAMPFPDESFDFVYCSAAFKNFAEPVKALDEMHRVLRSGGEAMIVDLRKDVPLQEIDTYIAGSGWNAINAWIIRQTFRRMLIPRALSEESFRRLVSQSRFATCRIAAQSIGLEIRMAK